MKLTAALVGATVILPFTVVYANAWGPEGHAIVADIAQAHLTPKAAAEISRLLALEHYLRLDDVSSWADDYRSSHPETGPWHFVDIPLHAKAYDEDRDCHFDKDDDRTPDLTCIVAKLPEFVSALSDKTKADPERLEALKFVVHFVGDVHQPLHAENNNDKGGNNVHLTYFGKAMKLHAVWDGGVIERRYSWTLGPNYSFDHAAVASAAKDLDAAISVADRSNWVQPDLLNDFDKTVVGWANETHKEATSAYAKLPKRKRGNWADGYQRFAWPVIEARLNRAGVRLAEVLNEALQ